MISRRIVSDSVTTASEAAIARDSVARTAW